MGTETSEKGGTTSCATSCAPCGEAETLFPTEDERRIDRLRAELDRLKQPKTLVSIEVPLATRNETNGAHGHWGKKSKKRKDERQKVGLRLLVSGLVPKVLRVTLTRLGGREMDHVGLCAALKSPQDAVAKWLKVDDAPSGVVDWRFEQEPGGDREEAVRVEIARLP